MQADDVATLVNVGVVCYLKQLLDTGLFMADPHVRATALPCFSTAACSAKLHATAPLHVLTYKHRIACSRGT